MIQRIFSHFKEQTVAHIIEVRDSIFPMYPISRGLVAFSLVPFLVAALGGYYAFAFFYLSIFCYILLFFRNPRRYPPARDAEKLVVSPADGRIVSIYMKPTPNHLGMSKEKKMRCISIFMGVFDVHVNRIPASGTIVSEYYKGGSFLSAYRGIAGVRNEAHFFRLRTESGDDIVFVQIAGAIARRIVSKLKDKQRVKIGEVFGMIRFGSRMEVYIPENYSIDHLVLNQKVTAGETVIARRV